VNNASYASHAFDRSRPYNCAACGKYSTKDGGTIPLHASVGPVVCEQCFKRLQHDTAFRTLVEARVPALILKGYAEEIAAVLGMDSHVVLQAVVEAGEYQASLDKKLGLKPGTIAFAEVRMRSGA